jgi:rhodanese-related sulfurtransferase
MATFPLPLIELLGSWGAFLIYGIIGFGFGYILESSGFANSTKLAAQFYLKEMTVLKVMFTAIIVAMLGIFLTSALGLLDYNLIWVNPTYLWPGIVGGLIMGVGFIIGGFCPGTSLAALATGKIDGMFFVGGVMVGIFLFGETVSFYDPFFNSSYLGRFTLPDWLGLPTGTVVLLVVIMALSMFLGAEYLEQVFGKKPMSEAPKWRLGGAGALMATAVVVVLIGQPTHDDRWQNIAENAEQQLASREVQITPDELLNTLWDDTLQTILLDVRGEDDYNQFHLRDAIHLRADEWGKAATGLQTAAVNTVIVIMSNDEQSATDAWKYMKAENVPNVYLLENGVNGWLQRFGDHMPIFETSHATDALGWIFPVALGERWEASLPHLEEYTLNFVPKIKLELQRGPAAGGCG